MRPGGRRRSTLTAWTLARMFVSLAAGQVVVRLLDSVVRFALLLLAAALLSQLVAASLLVVCNHLRYALHVATQPLLQFDQTYRDRDRGRGRLNAVLVNTVRLVDAALHYLSALLTAFVVSGLIARRTAREQYPYFRNGRGHVFHTNTGGNEGLPPENSSTADSCSPSPALVQLLRGGGAYSPHKSPVLPPDPVLLRECAICVETKAVSTGFRNGSGEALRCGHDSDVCQGCIAEHIGAQVRDHRNTEVTCMMPECDIVYELPYILGLGEKGADLTERIETLRTLDALRTLPGFTWCTRPGCEAGQVHDSGDIMTCAACGAKTCPVHQIPWHEGLSCKQYDRSIRPSVRKRIVYALKGKKTLSASTVHRSEKLNLNKLKIKKCPACHQGVQKNGGCDHMTCNRSAGGCGAEFCWICLADFNGEDGIRQVGNSAHLKSCRHYR